MKLLYITNGITGAGGLERVLAIKASVLAEDYGYEVHIVSLNEDNSKTFFEFSPKISQHTVQVMGNSIQYITRYIKGLKRKVKEINPDIISVCDDGLKGFFLPIIIDSRILIIYERHVSKMIEVTASQTLITKISNTLKFRLMNYLAKSFDRFIVLTESNKNEWKLKNIQVIPNPLPFFPERISSLQNKRVIAIGKQSYQKAYDLLIESWAQLPEHHQDWELHIYGKIEKDLQLADMAEGLGISKQIFFHSPEKKVEGKIIESSIFVLSSRYEGFGMVIIEAMSCGLPVVSFDCPHGPGDIIENNKTGFLVEYGNTSKFAEKLQLLMSDEELRVQMGSAGRKTSKKYNQENIIPQWDGLFKNLLHLK